MATWSKASLIIAAIFLLSLSCSASGVAHGRRSSSSSRRLVRSYDEPCKKMRLYLHDILYDYSNSTANSTAAAATKPTALSTAVSKSGYFFGRVVVFNDPVTEGKALEETAVRAQGLYFYDRKDAPNAWLAFSIVFNSTAQQGTLNLMGADLMSEKTRDISVVGGTGDFFMARGVATLRTDAVEGLKYFRLQMDISLYECCDA